MKFLELKIPPAFIFLSFGAAIWAVSNIFPSLNIHMYQSRVLIGIFTVLGIFAIIAGLYEFQKAKTTFDPLKPETASSVVQSGLYRFTRNPMYLGMLFMLMAYAIKYTNVLSLLLLIAFIIYMNKFQIIPEERAMTKKFGDEFVEYKKSVRRWI